MAKANPNRGNAGRQKPLDGASAPVETHPTGADAPVVATKETNSMSDKTSKPDANETSRRVLSYTYRLSDGSESDKIVDDSRDAHAVTAIVTVRATGERIECDPRKLPENALRMVTLFGTKQKLGNSVNGIKDRARMLETMHEQWNALLEDEWPDLREGGGLSAKMVTEAYANYVAAAQGKPCNDKQLAAIAAEVKTKGAKAVHDGSKPIQAEFAAIKAKRAAEAAERAKAEAKGFKPEADDALAAVLNAK